MPKKTIKKAEKKKTAEQWRLEGDKFAKKNENKKALEAYTKAVQIDGRSLKYVPKKLRTQEICLAAVQNVSHAISEVPEKSRSMEICLTAVKHRSRGEEIDFLVMGRDPTIFVLKHIPEKHKTYELFLAAVQCNSWIFAYTPDEFKTAELCLIAMKGSADVKVSIGGRRSSALGSGALSLVPNKLKTIDYKDSRLCA